jgi:uncharacterized membrane protein YtjA (UPF0391 family)
MPEDEKHQELKTQLWGWGLFVICSVLFIISGVRARDVVATLASILFLIGCVIFTIPLLKAIRRDDPPE